MMDVSQQPEASFGQPSAKRKQLAVIAVIVAVLVIGCIFWKILAGDTDRADKTDQNNRSDISRLLYDSLANAASQPILHVGMYRETYANAADADARQNAGSVMSSVSELNTSTAQYRSVFANNYLHYPGFSIGRCIDGTTYNEDYAQVNKAPRATSLEGASDHLRLLPEGHLYKVEQKLTFISCPRLGIIPGSSVDLATARLSDGVFPVTLSKEQAQNWKQKVQSAQLFTVKDEGVVQQAGKRLRKISFVPTSKTGVNQKLYDAFFDAAEIRKIQQEQPDGVWQHGFISVNPSNTGSVGGYYLIDEKAKLPVYSELYGTNPDKKTAASSAAGKNLARTWQNYHFPPELSITLNTPLEFLR